MKLIVCLDERKGMMFNYRRQSRDRILIEDLLRMVEEDRLWIAPYSSSLFVEKEKEILISDCLLEEAEAGDWCFIEDRACSSALSRIESIVIYWWNRHYPSDLSFDIDPLQEGFHLQTREEFVGSSHELITKEVFER